MLSLKKIMNVCPRNTQIVINMCKPCHKSSIDINEKSDEKDQQSKKVKSTRLAEFRKKLRETIPIDDLGEQPLMHPAQKEDPLPAWPNNTNPNTGEVGGPRGPEPTRYGDWERKGRVSDF